MTSETLKPCPIGIGPESREICSAGTCYWCIADRLHGLYQDGQLRFAPALDRVIGEVEKRYSGRCILMPANGGHWCPPSWVVLDWLRALRAAETAPETQDDPTRKGLEP